MKNLFFTFLNKPWMAFLLGKPWIVLPSFLVLLTTAVWFMGTPIINWNGKGNVVLPTQKK